MIRMTPYEYIHPLAPCVVLYRLPLISSHLILSYFFLRPLPLFRGLWLLRTAEAGR